MREIKKAYHAAAHAFHSDHNGHDPEAADERFKKIQDAYERIVEERKGDSPERLRLLKEMDGGPFALLAFAKSAALTPYLELRDRIVPMILQSDYGGIKAMLPLPDEASTYLLIRLLALHAKPEPQLAELLIQLRSSCDAYLQTHLVMHVYNRFAPWPVSLLPAVSEFLRNAPPDKRQLMISGLFSDPEQVEAVIREKSAFLIAEMSLGNTHVADRVADALAETKRASLDLPLFMSALEQGSGTSMHYFHLLLSVLNRTDTTLHAPLIRYLTEKIRPEELSPATLFSLHTWLGDEPAGMLLDQFILRNNAAWLRELASAPGITFGSSEKKAFEQGYRQLAEQAIGIALPEDRSAFLKKRVSPLSLRLRDEWTCNEASDGHPPSAP